MVRCLILLLVLAPSIDTTPSRVSWKSLARDHFDTTRILPIENGRWDGAARFLDSSKSLATEPLAEGIMLGDVVREMGERRNAKNFRGALRRLLAGQDGSIRAPGRVEALLVDSDVVSKSWTPDEGTRDDGFVYGRDLDLKTSSDRFWNSRDGDTEVFQVVSFISADLAALKEAENDYTGYAGRVGASYEEIGALPGKWFRGQGADVGPFDSLQIRFRSDLPFPFGTFSCHLHILNLIGDDGFLRTHVYSDSEDFYWLAGTDVFIPVKDSAGRFQGMIVHRFFGFDLRGVPDGKKQRVRGMRSGLGNLQRLAEPLHAKRGGRAIVDGSIPDYPVLGFLR